LYFNARIDNILPSVDINAFLKNRGLAVVTWGAAILDKSSELEGGSE
jgi:hypothetical protein